MCLLPPQLLLLISSISAQKAGAMESKYPLTEQKGAFGRYFKMQIETLQLPQLTMLS